MKNIFLIAITILLLPYFASSQTQVICGDQPVPAGWITTAIGVVCKQVNGVNYYQKTITRIDNLPAGSQVSTCGNDPLPTGWIIKSIGNVCFQILNVAPAITYCDKTIIKIDGLPTGSILSICSGDPIPCGWITTETHQPACYNREDVVPSIRYFTRIIEKIERVPIGTTIQVCNGDFNPPGWTTIQTGNVCFERRDVAPYVIINQRTIQKVASISCCVPEFITCPTSPGNLLLNGEFCLGNTGFSSQYYYCGIRDCLGSNSSEGWYAIGDDASCFHGGFQGRDHTTGSGNFLIVNGALSPNVNIWCETINVITNNTYNFSYWLSSMNASNLARLQVLINGIEVGSPFAGPNTLNNWQKFSVQWNSGSATTATICIIDKNTGFIGNDFGLDDISFTQTSSGVSLLSNLSISSGTLNPTFIPGTTIYTASVGNNISSITVTPTVADPNSNVKVNNVAVVSGSASGSLALNVGPNTIDIIVTAADGITTTTYTLTITRAAPVSSNANLSNLFISSGLLTPTFTANVTAYAASVTNCVSSITVTPIAEDATASIKVNGVVVVNGSSSAAIPLAVGSNTITVVVTAQDGTTTKSYTINVTRANPSTTNITAVSFPKESIPVNAGKIDFWAKLSGFSGTIPVGGVAPYFFSLNDGQSYYHLGFNSNDGQGNGGLTSVAGNTFYSGTGFFGSYSYEQIFGAGKEASWHHYVFQWNKDGIPGVNNGQQKVAVFVDGILNSGRWQNAGSGIFQPLLSGKLNLIALGNPGSVTGEAAIDEFKIFDGSNNLVLHNTLGSVGEITNSVTGQNGSFYQGLGNPHFVPGISGNAFAATPILPQATNCTSVNPDLSNLLTSAGTLTPVFSPGAVTYNVVVQNSVNNITVTPTAANSSATITVNNATVASGNPSAALPLIVGVNVISVVVTEFDGTNKLYTVIVKRAASANADLCGISLSNGTLSPSFNSNTTSYAVAVGNSVSPIFITPVSCDPAATIVINGGNVIATIVSGNVSPAIPLIVGSNPITLQVTAPDGTVKIYSIFVTRASIVLVNGLYVNDNTQTGDTYTTAIGNDVTGTGTPSAPFRSINKAMTVANAGDIIYVDAGAYSEYVNITKSLKLYGPNAGISPNTGSRNAEAIVTAMSDPGVVGTVAFDAHTEGTSVEIKGFKIINGTPLTDGHNSRVTGIGVTVLFEKNWIQHGTNLFAGTLTPWKKISINDNYFDAIDQTAFSSAIQINDAGTHAPTVSATINNNTIKTASFAGILLDHLLSAQVSGNLISNTSHAGILIAGGMVDAMIKENRIDHTNTAHVADAGGIKIHGSAFTGTVNFTNNIVTNSFNGFAVYTGENIESKGIHIHDNSFDATNTNKSVYHGGTGSLDATCNWLGTADAAILGSKVIGPVVFTPFLNDGTDIDPVAAGFQPTPGSCIGITNPCLKDIIAPVVVSKNATISLDATGHVTLQPADVIKSVTDNCDANPTIQLSRSVFSCTDVTNANGTIHQAYIAGTTTGNQGWGGELGMEFTVNNASGILVKQLGAFDHQGNGISGTVGPNNGIRVAIFNKATQTIVAGMDAIVTGNADAYTGNHRMKNITPVLLPPGNYAVVAIGYNSNEPNGNRSDNPAGDAANGAITFTGTCMYGFGNGFTYPTNVDGGPYNRYLAGTFSYSLPSSNNGIPVSISVTDAHGNTATETAYVLVLDPLGACNNNPCSTDNTAPVVVSKNATISLDANGFATLQAVDVIQSVTDNCDANPTVQLSRSVFNCIDIATVDGAVHQAYIANTTIGNQGWGGELGMEFTVNNASGILVKQLGTFDHLGNGINGTVGPNNGIRVAIFNKATQTIVAGLDAIVTGNADTYTGNHRMKNITPVLLPPGNYAVVAIGYNSNEPNGNRSDNPAGDAANGAITFTGTCMYGFGNGFTYPTNVDGGPYNRYLAGTFSYTLPNSNGSIPISITATDARGNASTVTANVLVLDPSGACNKRVSNNRSANLNAQVNAVRSMDNAEVIKVYPNPTNGQFSVLLSSVNAPSVIIEIVDQLGKKLEQKSVTTQGSTSSLIVPFNISNRPPGIYLIRVDINQRIKTIKIMKQ